MKMVDCNLFDVSINIEINTWKQVVCMTIDRQLIASQENVKQFQTSQNNCCLSCAKIEIANSIRKPVLCKVQVYSLLLFDIYEGNGNKS